ncbi:MAG: hypothetical protein ACKVS6_11000 [Planctomycetota bacterium]
MDPTLEKILDWIGNLLSKRELWMIGLFVVVPTIGSLIKSIQEAKKRKTEVEAQRRGGLPQSAPPPPPKKVITPPVVHRREPQPARKATKPPLAPPPPKPARVRAARVPSKSLADLSFDSLDSGSVGETVTKDQVFAAVEGRADVDWSEAADSGTNAFAEILSYNSHDWRSVIVATEIIKPPVAFRRAAI